VNLIKALSVKPWLTEGVLENPDDAGGYDLPTEKVGLKVFLTVATVIFTLVSVAYLERLTYGDWQPLSDPWFLWPNTALLIASSVALQWAVNSLRRGNEAGLRLGLLAGGILAWAFLAGQLLAWQQMSTLGYFASDNPANAFFFLITGLHGFHLLGGLVAWGRTMGKLKKCREIDEIRLSVELCTAYWHFLLVVWLIMFSLMLLT
jgi:cytochrome c oxidase subunit 3